jgi:hypothetical protein
VGDSIGVGDDVGIGDGVRDVESGLMIFDGDGKVGVEGSITIAYKQVVEDLCQIAGVAHHCLHHQE